MKGLILAGGSGTRLRPLTHMGPKQLIPVANKPVLFYAIEDLKAAGITDIGIVLGLNMPEKIRAAIGDGSRFGVNVTYIEQGEPKGIAHAVGCAYDFMNGEPFLVYLGDNILKGQIKSFVDKFLNSDSEAGILLSKVKDPQRFGVAEVKEGEVVSLEEKPKAPKSDLALVGIYLFRTSIFDVIKTLKPSWRNELEITEALQKLLVEGKVRADVVEGWWKDTGKPEDILEANHLVLDDLVPRVEGEIADGAKILGKVAVGKGSTVQRGCVLRGPVVIGENSKIGPDVYIGPYTSIGDDVSITQGDIESSIIMDKVTIECGDKIIDSLIGRWSRIYSVDGFPKGKKLIVGENSMVWL